MKNWILTHKLLTVILACVIGVGAACAVAIPIALRHKHEFSAEWTTDENYHWHKCKDEKCNEVSDKAAHVFDKETVSATYLASEATYTDAAKYYKSCVCGVKGAEMFDHGSSLSAKENVVELKEGVTLGKVYDGEAYALAAEEITRNGNGDVTVMYQRKGDADFGNTAPKNVGEYTVKVSVAATAEWKEAEKTFDFEITAKPLTANGTKVYDGNAVMPATLTGVIDGETVTATITMTSKNVGATVKEVMLNGKDKDNYKIETGGVTASITPMPISVDWWKEYDNSNIFTGDPTELLEGDEVTITVTMSSADAGAMIQNVALTGKDAGNYSLAEEDVTAEIGKADIDGLEISNAAAFKEGFYVGATNIPDPTTNYVEIGTGYGEKTIVWEKQLEDGVWSRNLTKEEVMESKTGTFRVHIKYAEGINYNFGDTSVIFTLNVKPRSLTVRNFEGKTYDGKPVENFTYDALVDMVNISEITDVTDITSPYDGEKYAEFRRKGEVLWTTVTDTYAPKNAAEYEYRIGIKATDEWAATVSEIKTLTIAQVEIKLEWGYTVITYLLQSGGLVRLAEYEPVAGEKVVLRLVNGKAGLELDSTNSSYVKQDQKKQVSVQDNLDCFILTATTNANVNNYKIVKRVSYQTSVEITVPPAVNGASNAIQGAWKTTDELYIETSVKVGYFKVGQTVIVYDSIGTKLLEAKIVKVHVLIDGSATGGLSGCVIPSDGKVRIDLDITGITYSGTLKGGTIRVK